MNYQNLTAEEKIMYDELERLSKSRSDKEVKLLSAHNERKPEQPSVEKKPEQEIKPPVERTNGHPVGCRCKDAECVRLLQGKDLRGRHVLGCKCDTCKKNIPEKKPEQNNSPEQKQPEQNNNPSPKNIDEILNEYKTPEAGSTGGNAGASPSPATPSPAPVSSPIAALAPKKQYISGYLLLIITDAVFPRGMLMLFGFFDRRFKQVHPSDLKFTVNEKKELGDLAEEAAKFIQLQMNPLVIFALMAGFIYYDKIDTIISEIEKRNPPPPRDKNKNRRR